MRKSFIWVILILCLGLSGKVFAQSQFSAVITKMENSLFGINYSTQSDDTRLKRIEKEVYGVPSSKPISQRIAKLKNDMAADLIGQEIKPKTDTFADESDSIKEDIPKEDGSVNYPIVNNLENKVFKKEYKNIDINQRLAKLEQKTFNKVYHDDLNTRVERLKGSIIPESKLAERLADDDYETVIQEDNQDNDLLSNESKQLYKNHDYNSQNSVLDKYHSNAGVDVPLAAMEKSIFKKVYVDDNTTSRLSRLETRIFNSTFKEDNPQDRIERLTSAYRAQKSSKKYDNNKHAQNMATAMQIGALLLLVLAAVL